MDLTRTSELEAVNTILAVMGEAPIDSLDVTGNLAAEKAQATLLEMSRLVQGRGWYFNTDYEYSMALSIDNKLPVAANMLEVVPDGSYYGKPYTQRGEYLYDLENQTFTFSSAITCKVIWMLDWVDIPEAARRYILVRAARTAEERGQGSEAVQKFTADDEMEARTAINRQELRMSRINSLTGSYTISRMLRNRRI